MSELQRSCGAPGMHSISTSTYKDYALYPTIVNFAEAWAAEFPKGLLAEFKQTSGLLQGRGHDFKLKLFNKLRSPGLGCARSDGSRDGAFRAEVQVQGVHGGVKNEMTIRASFKMACNLSLHRFRETPL